MYSRIRNCVECPKCHTRYVIGFSPYGNGSCLVEGGATEFTTGWLFCSCGRPQNVIRWNEEDLQRCLVSKGAHARGYGSTAEIVPVAGTDRVLRHRSVQL